MKNDPFEEIFALNLGDFLTEHLISDDLASKIKNKVQDQKSNLEKQLKELIAIYSIDNTLNLLGFNNKKDYIIYDAIAKTLTQMTECDVCHIFLNKDELSNMKDAVKDVILVGSSLGLPEKYDYSKGFNKDNVNLVNTACQANKIVLFKKDAILSDKEFFETIETDKMPKLYLAIPMHNENQSIGCILIGKYNSMAKPAKTYLELLEIIAKLFFTSLHLQKLIEKTLVSLDDKNIPISILKHLRAKLTVVIGDLGDEQQIFVEKLANAVDEKGVYQRKHSHQVASLAKEICENLNLNEKTKDLIYYAALLQNIGKIILPQELFNKKGKLTDEEFRSLQNSPNVGVNLLMSINFLSEVIPYIHYNKERWDGKGQPEGLSGQSIPLGSRIIAVADAYKALRTERPYRKAFRKEEALRIIKEEATVKWDPVIVEALIEVESLKCE